MKLWILCAAAVAASGLAGCQPKNNTASADAAADAPFEWGHPTGRYGGLGVYPTGQGWTKLAKADQPKDPAAAKTADDEHVIVVVDSKTGEIRQCGDFSGYCIGMNPWSRRLNPTDVEPVPMTSHTSSAEAASSSDAAPTAAESAAPPRHHRHHVASGVEPVPAH